MKLTPVMRQYLEIKERHKECILFFRMGDFYEMFFEDAEIASRILDIALTSRDKGAENPIPMCGIPYHSATDYINRLLDHGHKVAVCEQVEDPRLAKDIVKRDVTRVVTPGLPLDGGSVEPKDYNFLLSILPNGNGWGLAFVDPTTGDFSLTEVRSEEELESELTRIGPKEILVPDDADEAEVRRYLSSLMNPPLITRIIRERFESKSAVQVLRECCGERSLLDISVDEFRSGISAAGMLVSYIKDTQRDALLNLKEPIAYRVREYMILDPMTRRNIELTESLRGGKKGSLLAILDRTGTAMGGRKLKDWVSFPLIDVSMIRERLDAVEALKEDPLLRAELIDVLKGIHDIERILSKIALNRANPRDVVALKDSLKKVPIIKSLIDDLPSPFIIRLMDGLDEHRDIVDLIEDAMEDEPSVFIRDGGVIRDGYNRELDDLRTISRSGKEWILKLEEEERRRTGIGSLKIGYNKVFGYFIEVTKANLPRIPDTYIRKQTLVNAERFITPELKEYESKVLNAEERIIELERSIFEDILSSISGHLDSIQDTAESIASLDVILSLAQVAEERRYVKPEVDDSDILEIIEGRHPVVETMPSGERFVPNDTYMDCEDNQILIITGPNMAGKSTYIRQVALITLMAQMGSFVPASSARIGVVDRIFARIGAMDDISKGDSTFMVEMKGTAHILHFATRRSLIVLDEIGRGTSTFDGVSIAWAVVEYIHNHPSLGARTLFATHYHELTELSLTNRGIKNYNVAVKEWNDRIIFLRKIVPGSTNKSYGIQVAKLAGVPSEVIEKARSILYKLEMDELDLEGIRNRSGDATLYQGGNLQLSLFSKRHEPAINELKRLDIDNMTPVEAIVKLQELKRMVEEG